MRTKLTILLLLVTSAIFAQVQPMGYTDYSVRSRMNIGNGTLVATNASASLELKGTDRGFLPNRLTTVQRDAIVSPATGLMIYNLTTSQYNVYTGASWEALGGTGNFIQNQYAGRQVAKAYIDTLRASSVYSDSLFSYPSDTFTVKNRQKPHFAAKGDVAYYWSITEQKWLRILPQSNTASVQQMVSEFSVIDDKGRYDFLPNPVVNEDTLLIFSKNGSTHSGDGDGVVYKSTDGGNTWDSLSLAAQVVAALSAGKFAPGHLVYSYSGYLDSTVSNRIYYKYSRDGGRTWTLSDSVSLLRAHPHGEMITLPGGRMIQSVWQTDYSKVNGNLVFVRYSDDGITWDSLGLISATPGSTAYNETSIEVVSGTTNENAVLVAIARREDGNSYASGQFYSTDGGATWTFAGTVTFGSESGYRAPTFLKAYRGYLYAVKGVRGQVQTSGTYNFISYKRAPLTTVYNDTTKWSTATPKLYQSSGHPIKTTALNHFGYTMPFIYAGKLMLTAYDLSPRTIKVTGVANPTVFYTRMFVMPVLRSPYFEGLGYGNQSIPTGTATKVAFQTVYYDTEGYAAATDSGYLVKRDGDYSFTTTVTIAGDTTGTYRRVYVAVDDPGVTDTSGRVDAIIQDRTISGTSSNDFNKVTLSGTVFAKAGTYIRVYAIHDATTSLDIINSLAAYRARLIVKQIQ